MNREDDTSLIAVVEAVFVASCETDFYQKVFVVAVLYSVIGEGGSAVWAVAELEAVDDGVAESTFVEVGETHRLTFIRCHHDVGEVILREAVDVEHALAFVLCRQFFRSLFAFLNLDAVFFRQITQCFLEGIMLMFHDETHRVAGFAAAEAFEDVSGWVDVERRRFLFVERAHTDEVGATFAERDEFAHHVFDACCLDDLVYGFAWNHIAQIKSPPMIIIPETTRSMRQKPMMSFALSLAIANAGNAQKGWMRLVQASPHAIAIPVRPWSTLSASPAANMIGAWIAQ